MGLYYILFLETLRGDFFITSYDRGLPLKEELVLFCLPQDLVLLRFTFFFRNTMVLMHLAFHTGINNTSSKDLAFSLSQQI